MSAIFMRRSNRSHPRGRVRTAGLALALLALAPLASADVWKPEGSNGLCPPGALDGFIVDYEAAGSGCFQDRRVFRLGPNDGGTDWVVLKATPKYPIDGYSTGDMVKVQVINKTTWANGDRALAMGGPGDADDASHWPSTWAALERWKKAGELSIDPWSIPTGEGEPETQRACVPGDWSAWGPDPKRVCRGVKFTQTRSNGCETESHPDGEVEGTGNERTGASGCNGGIVTTCLVGGENVNTVCGRTVCGTTLTGTAQHNCSPGKGVYAYKTCAKQGQLTPSIGRAIPDGLSTGGACTETCEGTNCVQDCSEREEEAPEAACGAAQEYVESSTQLGNACQDTMATVPAKEPAWGPWTDPATVCKGTMFTPTRTSSNECGGTESHPDGEVEGTKSCACTGWTNEPWPARPATSAEKCRVPVSQCDSSLCAWQTRAAAKKTPDGCTGTPTAAKPPTGRWVPTGTKYCNYCVCSSGGCSKGRRSRATRIDAFNIVVWSCTPNGSCNTAVGCSTEVSPRDPAPRGGGCSAPTNWGPSRSTVACGVSFEQSGYDSCMDRQTRTATGTKGCGNGGVRPPPPRNDPPPKEDPPEDPPPKEDPPEDPPSCTPRWTPAPSTVCSGKGFKQGDGCGNSRDATGTKTTGECDDDEPVTRCTPNWTPAPSTVCKDKTFTQTDGCGNSNPNAVGTKTTGECAEDEEPTGNPPKWSGWSCNAKCTKTCGSAEGNNVRTCTPGTGDYAGQSCSGNATGDACSKRCGPDCPPEIRDCSRNLELRCTAACDSTCSYVSASRWSTSQQKCMDTVTEVRGGACPEVRGRCVCERSGQVRGIGRRIIPNLTSAQCSANSGRGSDGQYWVCMLD